MWVTGLKKLFGVLRVNVVNLLFNVTINDISVIFVTTYRCAGGLKKLDLRSGSQRHRHFVGFFNGPVQAPTRDHPFYTVIPRPLHLVAFYDTLGIRRTHSRLNPPGPHGCPVGVIAQWGWWHSVGVWPSSWGLSWQLSHFYPKTYFHMK